MVLKELTDLRGPSGWEAPVRDYILEKIKPVATSVRVDRAGNIIAFKKGRKENAKNVLFGGHMDEVGFIILGANDDGLLSYRTVGGIDPRVVVSKRVKVGEKGIPGVIGSKAIHLQSGADRNSVLGHDRLFIDIGVTDKKAAEALVSPGDYATFDSEWREFGNGLVKAKALDDRVGCAVMMSLLENEYDCDLTCIFFVQEETGLRGSSVALDSVDADLAIVLEGTTANDMGDVPDAMKVCRPGKGVAISFMDFASIGYVPLWRRLRSLAEEKGIAYQLKTYVSGGNDAGALQTQKGPLKTAVLSVPCRYIHSPSSVAALSDVEAMYLLADAFLSAGGTIK